MKRLRLTVTAACFVLSLLAAGAEGLAFAGAPGQQADLPRRPGDVAPAEARAPMVYVTGGVRTPMALHFRESLTVKMAVAMVGGLRRDANEEKLIIYRHAVGSTEAATTINVNLKEIRKGRAEDIKLQADDILWVPCKVCGSGPPATLPSPGEVKVTPPSPHNYLRVIY